MGRSRLIIARIKRVGVMHFFVDEETEHIGSAAILFHDVTTLPLKETKEHPGRHDRDGESIEHEPTFSANARNICPQSHHTNSPLQAGLNKLEMSHVPLLNLRSTGCWLRKPASQTSCGR